MGHSFQNSQVPSKKEHSIVYRNTAHQVFGELPKRRFQANLPPYPIKRLQYGSEQEKASNHGFVKSARENWARANQRNAPSAPIDDDEFQTHTFVSPQAAKDFQDRAKSIIPERELLLDEERNPEIFDNVMKRGWQSFIEDPGEANVSMVREFFANAAHSDSNTSVKVRDVVVRFDPAHINNYFNLPDLSLEGYNTVKKKTIFDDLIRTLCPRGTSWKGEKKSFNRSELSKEAKACANFVSAHLLPTSAVSTVLPPRLLLIYAIIIGIDINWAGVPTRENDETMKPQLPIKDVFSYKDVVGPDNPGMGGDDDEGDAQNAPAPRRAAQPRQKGKQSVQEIGDGDREWKEAVETHLTFIGKMLRALTSKMGCDTTDIAEPLPFPRHAAAVDRPESSRARRVIESDDEEDLNN
ncbi:PREDICTED: uncharacterized protein LOC105978044 [Erythranthe guttata]|uniref:uncharacterized protein LOC105978044 n=1 Tax=Erythranthe guttata TaxID=4155 RepID=UPI00064D786A|nr:PREDICTED: uncharacterized protein LOC105978044 [Erythranthe guttata]|eukprot:XP_012858909.1 PREDICTED: uncharacterized protein LOC105978044 [Erythranthe guttata]